jgi:hypothetical protein
VQEYQDVRDSHRNHERQQKFYRVQDMSVWKVFFEKMPAPMALVSMFDSGRDLLLLHVNKVRDLLCRRLWCWSSFINAAQVAADMFGLQGPVVNELASRVCLRVPEISWPLNSSIFRHRVQEAVSTGTAIERLCTRMHRANNTHSLRACQEKTFSIISRRRIRAGSIWSTLFLWTSIGAH